MVEFSVKISWNKQVFRETISVDEDALRNADKFHTLLVELADSWRARVILQIDESTKKGK